MKEGIGLGLVSMFESSEKKGSFWGLILSIYNIGISPAFNILGFLLQSVRICDDLTGGGNSLIINATTNIKHKAKKCHE